MNKVEILHEVNRLIVAGHRKSAIDIIQEYLEKSANDPVMLRALGRIYLLEKKPGLIDSNFGRERNLMPDSADFVNTNQADSSYFNDSLFSNLAASTIFSENWQYDPCNNEEETGVEEFDIDEKGDALIITEIEDALTGKELIGDDLDEIDELNDPDNTDLLSIFELESTGKLYRFEKAKQIAAEVIQAYGWGKEHISLLELVFVENGWGMARVSIEREINDGLIPEELELALFIRKLWAENPQFWISFIHITSNQPGQETKAVYKNMSWAESLRIIRSFNNVPTEEELQFFIYQIYDDWYCSTTLRRQFKAFIKYVKYCTSLDRRSFSGNEIFSFVDSFYSESL